MVVAFQSMISPSELIGCKTTNCGDPNIDNVLEKVAHCRGYATEDGIPQIASNTGFRRKVAQQLATLGFLACGQRSLPNILGRRIQEITVGDVSEGLG